LLDCLSERGQVCKWLIVINVCVFAIQLLTRVRLPFEGPLEWKPGPFTDALLLNTERVMAGEIWRLLTYAFLHSPFMWQHIVFNMLFLWWFGSDIEELYGPREFLAFYLASALAGGLVFEAAAVVSGRPMQCLGASGAVMGVMVLCACHYPTRTIYLFFVLPIPIWIFVAFQVAQDAFYFIDPEHHLKTQTAVAVHLGGAGFAFLYYKAQLRLLNLWPG